MELTFDEEENTNWDAYCDSACVCALVFFLF